HIGFEKLVGGEQIDVSIPLRFTGKADGVCNSGGILEEAMHQVHLRVDPSAIPSHIEVDVTPLTIGHSLHVSDLKLPEGATILDDAGATVCVCTAPKVEEAPAAAAAEGAEAAPTPDPELIRKPKPEEEEEAKK